jgi:hypothetical protein
MNEIDLQLKTVAPVATEADKVEQVLEADIPEKFRGKTLKDVIKSYEEAEKKASRLANEVAEVRKVADTLIGLEQDKRTSKQDTKAVPVTTEELLEDTPGALNKAVEANPVVQKAVETAENLERQMQYQAFERDFPAFKEDLANPEFTTWIQKNRARAALAAAASDLKNPNGVDAARGLWELWEERKQELGSAQSSEKVQKEAEAEARRKQAQSAAELEGGVTGEGSTEMVYDRQKLMQLRILALRGNRNASEQLKKLQPKLTQAYADKRVRY